MSDETTGAADDGATGDAGERADGVGGVEPVGAADLGDGSGGGGPGGDGSADEYDPEEPGWSPEPVGGRVVPDIPPDLDATLGEVRDWLRTRIDKGARCPACEQRAQVYRRQIYAGMVRALILMWREGDFGRRLYVHVPSIDPARGGDVAKLEHWGLIEEERGTRIDGGRAGYWRVTARGQDWIERKTTVPKYARIYDGRLLSLTGPAVSIDTALGTAFRLDDLMAGI
jgi:hypothetical protein